MKVDLQPALLNFIYHDDKNWAYCSHTKEEDDAINVFKNQATDVAKRAKSNYAAFDFDGNLITTDIVDAFENRNYVNFIAYMVDAKMIELNLKGKQILVQTHLI